MMHNPFEELNREIVSLNKKVDLLLRRTGKVNLFDEFNIKGLEKAANILGISKEALRYKIKKEDTLKENVHYRKNSGGRYSFSESALLSIKGLI